MSRIGAALSPRGHLKDPSNHDNAALLFYLCPKSLERLLLLQSCPRGRLRQLCQQYSSVPSVLSFAAIDAKLQSPQAGALRWGICCRSRDLLERIVDSR
jgi:hypothetical protein